MKYINLAGALIGHIHMRCWNGGKVKYINADHPANKNIRLCDGEAEWVYGHTMPRRDLAMQHVHEQAIIRVVEDWAYEQQQRKIRRANAGGERSACPKGTP